MFTSIKLKPRPADAPCLDRFVTSTLGIGAYSLCARTRHCPVHLLRQLASEIAAASPFVFCGIGRAVLCPDTPSETRPCVDALHSPSSEPLATMDSEAMAVAVHDNSMQDNSMPRKLDARLSRLHGSHDEAEIRTLSFDLRSLV